MSITHNLKYKDYVQIIKGQNDKDPRWEKYLYHRVARRPEGDHRGFPRVWRPGGTVQKFSSHKYTLPYQLHNFRLYVNDKDYFMSKLPPVSASWSKGKTLNEKTIYDIRRRNSITRKSHILL